MRQQTAAQPGWAAAVGRWIHHYFIWLVLASYAVAACYPGPGLWLRGVTLGRISVFGQPTTISLSIVMLAGLLMNAGLGVKTSELKNLLYRPALLVLGLLANLAIPIAFIFLISQGMRFWHNADEVQNILVGLALVASMPIAGSSTAWSQNANGNLALSLALVLFSTMLSPLTTPIALHAVGLMTTGEYSEDLHELADGATGSFLLVSVIIPSLLGIGLRTVAGERRIESLKPTLKLGNSVNLLLLNYSNAAVSLPGTIANPDWDFLLITLSIVIALCVLAFAAGWLISSRRSTLPSERAALMFGLGMNNNGTGLVLAAMALADHPQVLLPIIFYNLTQHLVAAVVNALLQRDVSRGSDVHQADPALPLDPAIMPART